MDVPGWAKELLASMGSVAGFIFLLVWYVPRDFAARFVSSQEAQALAMQKVGDQLQVISGQAGKLDEISDKIDDIKFNSDVFGERLVRIEERLIDVRRQDNLQS